MQRANVALSIAALPVRSGQRRWPLLVAVHGLPERFGMVLLRLVSVMVLCALLLTVPMLGMAQDADGGAVRAPVCVDCAK